MYVLDSLFIYFLTKRIIIRLTMLDSNPCICTNILHRYNSINNSCEFFLPFLVFYILCYVCTVKIRKKSKSKRKRYFLARLLSMYLSNRGLDGSTNKLNYSVSKDHSLGLLLEWIESRCYTHLSGHQLVTPLPPYSHFSWDMGLSYVTFNVCYLLS